MIYCEGCEAEGRTLNNMGYCPECIAAAIRGGHAWAVQEITKLPTSLRKE